jgi:serine/threonine protein kinase
VYHYKSLQPDSDKLGVSDRSGRHEANLPQVFGRYLLIQRLSRGGMGEIFLAKHGLAGFEKLAVIKKVLPHLAADAQFISRFVDEAQVAIKLQHVNVAQVFEVGRVGDEYFLALEYVDGRDLRRILTLLSHQRQRLPVDLALFIARELANGLAYAHRRTGPDGGSLNLVHCDISPPNVLVSFEGETKVIDFGIAKSALRGTATDPKLGFGKFGYMAPEQLIRGGSVDHRTDIYAAGVVLFEVLTGQRLYEGGPDPDYKALARKVSKGEHKLPSEVDPSLASYDDLVATALRPNPDDRYQTAAELRDAIQQALVAVNPTISTDQLGAYLRELFADEMTAQRELHDRVAQAHLADFQDQFDQTVATVSFAVAQLPADLANAIGDRPAFAAGSLNESASATVPRLEPIPTYEGGLATGTGKRARQRVPRGRRLLYVLAAAALGVGLAVIVFGAIGRGHRTPNPAEAVANSPRAIIVEPIETGSNVPAPVASAAVPQPQQDAAVTAPVPDPKRPPKLRRDTGKHDRVEKTDKPDAAKPEITLGDAKKKFSQATLEYKAYKDKNGPRLEQEWNNLAIFITHKMENPDPASLDEVVRRIEEFRGRLKH